MASSKDQTPGLNSHNPGWQADSRPKLQAPESSQASCPAALRWHGPLPPPFAPGSRRTASLAAHVHSAAFLPGSCATGLKATFKWRAHQISHEALKDWAPGTPGGFPWPRRAKMSHKPSAAENVHAKSVSLQAKHATSLLLHLRRLLNRNVVAYGRVG